MVTLANVQGSSLVPDLSQPLGILRQAFGTPQSRAAGDAAAKAAAQRQKAIDELLRQQRGGTEPGLDGAFAGTPEGETSSGIPTTASDTALRRLAILDPKAAKSFQDVRDRGDARELEEVQREIVQGVKQANLISGEKDFAAKQRAIKSLASERARKGLPMDKILKLINIPTEPELDLELRRMQVMGQDAKTALGQGRFTKGTSFITEDASGSQVLATPILDQRGGTMRVDTQPLTGALLSKLGETPEGESSRKVRQAQQTASAKQRVKLATEPEIATATGTAKAEVARDTKLFERGITAADAMPDLKRSIELLDLVKTGGFARANLAVKQFFGFESGDEAELSTGLGKAVLSQLRDTFGAAFTAQEGAQLKVIEAGFGKSVAGNRRLLSRALKLTERVANRAIKRAESVGNTRMAEELREAMAFSLTPEGAPAAPAAAGNQPAVAIPSPQAAPAAGSILNFDAQGNLIPSGGGA